MEKATEIGGLMAEEKEKMKDQEKLISARVFIFHLLLSQVFR